MIVDAHTHRYPDDVIRDPETYANQAKEFHWLGLVKPEQGPTLQGWADRRQMLADMENAGVDKAVLLGWYWENPDSCILHNDWHAQWIEEDADRFIAFVTLHPSMKDPLAELSKRQQQGFVGIGEAHPWVQSANMRQPAWLECMAFASEAGWPVTFHVTEPVGHDYPGRIPTPLEEFLWLAREFPDLKIILAHAGGLLPFYELNPRVRPFLKNVYYDLAACSLLYDPSIYRKLIDAVGAEKILWGTDYPLRILPDSQKKPDFSAFRREVLESANLTKEQEDAILGNNLLSLLPC